MRISGCSTADAAIDPPEVPLRASTNSGARSDTDSGFDFRTNTGCDSDLEPDVCTLNFGCSILMDARVVVVGLTVVAIEGETVCVPGINVLGMNGSRSNATMASKVTHRTVKRVVGLSLGSSFRKSRIATAKNAPSQIPL